MSATTVARSLLGCVLVLGLSAGPAHAVARPEATLDPHVPGEVLVRLQGSDDWKLVRARAGEPVARAIARLEDNPAIADASPNFVYRSAGAPDDARYDYLWSFENTGQSGGTLDADVDAETAWQRSTGSSSVIVAVVDSGVASDHPDLAPNMWQNDGEAGARASNGIDDDGNGLRDDARGWDWYADDNDPADENGHGTHVAGVIAARGNDGYGVAGLSWRSRIMPLRVLGPDGSGTTADIASAFRYAVEHGARVVNASLGGPDRDPVLGSVIASAPDVLFVVAAGNSGADVGVRPFYPCNEQAANLLCVGATDASDRLASFSNFGASYVDIAAPGKSIVSTWLPESAAAVGTYSLSDSYGAYEDDSDGFYQNATPIAVPSGSLCRLSYAIRAELAPGDAFSIQRSSVGDVWVSVDGATVTGTTSGSFARKSASFVADASAVSLRLRLQSNGSGRDDGVFVDDMALECDGTPVWSEGFETDPNARWVAAGTPAGWGRERVAGEWAYSSGTSMAAPHVAGVAALIWSVAPSATVAHARAVLLAGADRLDGLDGKIGGARRLNAGRTLGYAGDLTAPVAAGVSVAGLQRARTFRPSWSATDAGSGVASHDVRVRAVAPSGSSGEPRAWRTGSTSTSGSYVGSPGQTYCFSQRSTDRALNRSFWTGEHCSTIPYDDTSLSSLGGWSRRADPLAYLGTVSVGTARGARLVRTGVAYEQLWLVATTCPVCGVVDVFRGGTRIARVSLASATTQARRIIAVDSRATRTAPATLTIRIASAGKVVRIEGFAVRSL